MKLVSLLITTVLSQNTVIKKGGFSGKFKGETFESVEGDDPVWRLLESHAEAAKSANDVELVDAIRKHKQLSYMVLYRILGEAENTQKPVFGLISQYGCWCLPQSNSNFTAGYGQPIDDIDKMCRHRAFCVRCATQTDFVDIECSPKSGYKFKGDVNIVTGKREILCEDPVGSCKHSICSCDKALADDIFEVGLERWNADNSVYPYGDSETFNRADSCNNVVKVSTTVKPVVIATEEVTTGKMTTEEMTPEKLTTEKITTKNTTTKKTTTEQVTTPEQITKKVPETPTATNKFTTTQQIVTKPKITTESPTIMPEKEVNNETTIITGFVFAPVPKVTTTAEPTTKPTTESSFFEINTENKVSATEQQLYDNFGEEYENTEYSHEKFMENYYNYEAAGESYWDRNLEESDQQDYYTETVEQNDSNDAASNLFSSSNVFSNVDSGVTESLPLAVTTSVYEQAKQTWDVIFENDSESSEEVNSLSSHNECCGVYPKRVPLNHKGHQTRSCCHDARTYDQSLHSCCDDGRVVAFGSC